MKRPKLVTAIQAEIRQAVVATRTGSSKREALEDRGARPADSHDKAAPAQPSAPRSPTSA